MKQSWTRASAMVLVFALGAVAFASAGSATGNTGAAACRTARLVVWLDTQGDATAGSVYYKLKFTNQSGHTCTLSGYPGVSAVGLDDRQLGSAASRTQSAVRAITLRVGATANAELRIAVAGNFPQSACHRVSAAGLRVFPPGQTVSKVVPLPFEACSRSGPVYLNVKAVAV